MENKASTSLVSLTDVISTVIQIPGAKVDRELFLRDQFRNKPKEVIDSIVDSSPIEAGCSQKELHSIAQNIVNQRTTMSSFASFAAGIPGGLAMAATIPADMIQFYGVALRMAQEIAYLYGEPDLWENKQLSSERVENQLILYCGAMLGSTGAVQTVKLMSAALAKQTLKTLPQKALTKTFYYPIVKSISKAFGAKMTKEIFSKGVSKAIPVLGGFVSGGITFLTMRPMGFRLADALEEAHFSYTEKEIEQDIQTVQAETERVLEEEKEEERKSLAEKDNNANAENDDVLEQILKAKKMMDDGILSPDEFLSIKARIISKKS